MELKETMLLPELPREILAMCKQFKANPNNRSVFAKKIYESDMGSRRDISEPSSSIMKYLPPKIILSREEIIQEARQVIAEVGATDKGQMGSVMRELMPGLKGRADGRLVNEVVRELLTG